MTTARRTVTVALTLLVVAGLVGIFEMALLQRASDEETNSFAASIKLDQLGQVPVHSNGRLKALDSFTSAMMQEITGPKLIDGQSRTFTYLDMMFRPSSYTGRDVIYIGKKVVRERLVGAMLREREPEDRPALLPIADAIVDSGMISVRTLQDPAILDELQEMRRDLIRTAKFVNALELAFGLMQPNNLQGGLRMVPPREGSATSPWFTPQELQLARLPEDFGLESEVAAAWTALGQGWRSEDAAAVNTAASTLVGLLQQVNPGLYPKAHRAGWPWSLRDASSIAWTASSLLTLASFGLLVWGRVRGKPSIFGLGTVLSLAFIGLHLGTLWIGRFNALALESFYFQYYAHVNLIWVLYLLSGIPIIMALVYRWDTARLIGLTAFGFTLALHSAALLLRWYVADRWPNSNMFEAVTTAAWFGGVGAMVIEILVRRTSMRGLFALGSAAASMTAFMAAHFLPQALNANITNKMPVLDDVWLYIHTNIIIFSYCLIFMAAVVAGCYLFYRLIAMIAGFGGPQHYARVGGAGSLISVRPDGTPYLASERTTFGQVLDGATMILMELSFILLWTGLVMGAIWADHSWGRPWGWDPKEVFALNTFLVFAVLIHVRLKTKDKGLWTSLLTIAGCMVMLFNWIFINFKIAGLHSYA